jgi:hypothetical protein
MNIYKNDRDIQGIQDFFKSKIPSSDQYKKQIYLHKNENNKSDFAFVESFFQKPEIKS